MECNTTTLWRVSGRVVAQKFSLFPPPRSRPRSPVFLPCSTSVRIRAGRLMVCEARPKQLGRAHSPPLSSSHALDVRRARRGGWYTDRRVSEGRSVAREEERTSVQGGEEEEGLKGGRSDFPLGEALVAIRRAARTQRKWGRKSSERPRGSGEEEGIRRGREGR